MYPFSLPTIDKSQKIAIFWFRRDLRIHDNSGLYAALNSGYLVLPMFIYDTNILLQLESQIDTRVDFIHQAIAKLQQQFLSVHSSLFVAHGKPFDIVASLCSNYSIAAIYCNRDYEPYGTTRDAEIAHLCASKQILFKTYKDHVVFESHEIRKANASQYTIYTPYAKVWKTKLQEQSVQAYSSEQMLRACLKYTHTQSPTLQDIGFQKTPYTLQTPILDETILKNYKQTRDFPALQGTSRISEHLRFGTISIRQALAVALRHEPTWLGELIWRDFFMAILHTHPHVTHQNFSAKYNAMQWQNNPSDFDAWCQGKTGYPIVDAGMRELNATGFMHNRVRMITASFLCKHVLIDWQWGEAYFAQKLIDYELSSNNGNWQWAASTGCDAAPYFRIFNPQTQQQKFDAQQEYCKTWIPELNSSSYPQPMVEHTVARQRALNTYKRIFLL